MLLLYHPTKNPVHDPVLISTIEEIPPDEQTQSLGAVAGLSYNMGYGDFCFGRFINRFDSSVSTGTKHDNNYWREGSNGIPVPELRSVWFCGSGDITSVYSDDLVD
jgi:hypothetical protein